jgi:hypothetical protein
VRRASDNSEKDFSAADVSSGAMTGWVNAQIVPPLDIRELVDGERTGDLVEAAAAYSLRNLSSSYTGDVVVVRRSSDDAEESFTAAEVADGTLEDWVNTDVNTGPSSGVYTKLSGTGTISNATINSFDVDAGAAGLATNHTGSFRVEEGETVKVNATITGDFTSGSIFLVSGSSFVLTSLLSGTNDYELTATSYLPFADLRLNNVSSTTGFSFVINSIQIIKSNGYVVIWYDQSGNGNPAVQTTAASQPKIVDGGSLVSGGLEFDGVNDGLSVSGQVLTSSLFYATSVMNHATGTSTANGQNAFGQYQIGTSGRFQLSANASNEYSFFANATDPIVGFSTGAIGTAQTLISINGDGSNAEIWRDGTSKATDAYSGFTPANVNFTIGIDASGDREFNGNIAEVIIYNSDQSDNRTAIEANIGDHYDIDLPSGVDTGYDQVDGFVETWYDQSGNGNDAVQDVAASQPQIVDGGSLITRGANSEPSILFGGAADNRLDVVGRPIAKSVFSALQASNTNFETLICDTTDNAPRATTNNNANNRAYKFEGFGTPSVNVDGVTYNGTSNVSSLGFHLLGMTSGSGSSINRIGANPSAGSTGNSFNYVSELILYPSDQSANREAIETNINNQYSIY